jgi:hypothetical protein
VKLKKNQFSKKNKKNEVQNWHKNKNNVVIKWWNWKKINFTKGPRKKIRNQKDQLNWLINFYKRANAKKKKFKRMRTKLETILFDKLEFND